MNRKTYIIATLLALTAGAMAQEADEATPPDNVLAVDAQLRTRAEYRHGAVMPLDEGESAAKFVNDRARLTIQYDRGDMTFHVSGQHTGVWGQDPQVDKNGRFALNEAWAQLFFGQGLFVKVGRQQLAYDDERILGALDWNTAGRSHDALKVGYEDTNNLLHLILAYNQNDETTSDTPYQNGGQPYKAMQTVWYHFQSSLMPFEASVLFMNLGLQGETKTRFMQTFGAYATYKYNEWNFAGSFYFQTGRNKADESVGAWMGSARATYTIDPQWKVALGYDYLSGDVKLADGNQDGFDPLYGTHHKFYGAMDYFYTPGFTDHGLQDFQASGRYTLSKKVNMQLDYHFFRMNQSFIESDGTSISKNLGHELDFQVNCALMKDVSLAAGVSAFKGTATMDFIKGGSHKRLQEWGWVSLNINPRIFYSEW